MPDVIVSTCGLPMCRIRPLHHGQDRGGDYRLEETVASLVSRDRWSAGARAVHAEYAYKVDKIYHRSSDQPQGRGSNEMTECHPPLSAATN